MSFQVLRWDGGYLGWWLKIDRDSVFRMGLGRSFHQPVTVNENILESDFVPLCDDTTRQADLRLLEGM